PRGPGHHCQWLPEMAPFRPWWIRLQPGPEDFIGCESNDDQEKIMKQNSVSGTRPLVYLGIAALMLGIGYGWVRSTHSSPPAPAPTLPLPAKQAAAHEDA